MKKDIHTKEVRQTDDLPQQHKPFRSSYTKTERFLARLALLAFVFILTALFYTAFTGGSAGQLLALLFCLIVIPCLLFAFRLYVRYTSGKNEERHR